MTILLTHKELIRHYANSLTMEVMNKMRLQYQVSIVENKKGPNSCLLRVAVPKYPRKRAIKWYNCLRDWKRYYTPQ